MNNYFLMDKLAKVQAQEAIKIGLRSQQFYAAMSLNNGLTRQPKTDFLRRKIRALESSLQQFADSLQCRVLGVIYSRSC